MMDEMSGGKCLYAFMRVIDPNTQLPKNVLINWVGPYCSHTHTHTHSTQQDGTPFMCVCGMSLYGSKVCVLIFVCTGKPNKGWDTQHTVNCCSLPQQGEGVQGTRKGVCARHTLDVSNFFFVSPTTVSHTQHNTHAPRVQTHTHTHTGSSCDHQCQVGDGPGGGQCPGQGGQSFWCQFQLPQGEGQTNA